MDKLKALFQSRKFYASLIGVALVLLRHFAPSFPLSDDELTKIMYVVVAYIVGTGLADARA